MSGRPQARVNYDAIAPLYDSQPYRRAIQFSEVLSCFHGLSLVPPFGKGGMGGFAPVAWHPEKSPHPPFRKGGQVELNDTG